MNSRRQSLKWVIFTDGSCLGNPGPGGCAAILRTPEGERCLSWGYRWTTNNRMEMLAAIHALESLQDYRGAVELHTDSQYLHKGMQQWLAGWVARHWRRADGQAVKNRDLWERLAALSGLQSSIEWFWVRGHKGHPENERCDRMAQQAARSPTLRDEGFAAPG